MHAEKQQAALAYVRALDLPQPEPGFAPRAAGETLDVELDKKKAALVGSEIIAFVEGVTPERRQLIVQSSLLAQLAAKKRVPNQANIADWYTAYLDVLGNIGWAIQGATFRRYDEYAAGFDAHEAITKAATALIGGGPALAAVLAIVGALKDVSDGKSWFTLFNREVQVASTAHFQVSLVHQGDGDQFMVSLMAFAITAEEGLTQVTFFKFNTRKAKLDYMSADVTVGLEPGSEVAQAIARKVAKFQDEYIEALDL